MAKKLRDPWLSRRRNAIDSAKTLVASIANSLPVDLKRIAANRAVHRIEFTPLLTDGGLAVRDDGFFIYVRSDTAQSADLTARFAADGTGTSLPAAISRRARFTIAHEIAHTFFYDIRRKPPRLKTEVGDGVSAANLELACNQIAGLILIPEALMERDFAKFEFLHPGELRLLGNRAIVSAQAVINRFKHLSQRSHPEAILATVTRDGVDWKISAISRHYSMRNIFFAAKVGASIRTLVDNPDFVLSGGSRLEGHSAFIGHGGMRTLRVSCENERVSRSNSSLFVVGTPMPKDGKAERTEC